MKADLRLALDFPSGKTAYLSQKDAEGALNAMANHPPRRANHRSRKAHAAGRRWAAYQCGSCRLWHLTSGRPDARLAFAEVGDGDSEG